MTNNNQATSNANMTDKTLASSDSPKTKEWKAAILAGLMDPPGPYVAPDPDIPDSFFLVGEAGSGCNADAYFCLPKDAVTVVKACKQGNVADKVNVLMSKLQVVKVSCPIGYQSLREEIAALKTIREQQPYGVYLPFFDLTGMDTSTPLATWFASSALPLCCDLGTLIERYCKMPEYLVWLIFSQLRKALHFLHNTCDPPLIHNDLHTRNVVIGYSGGSDFPQVRVIDFGLSKSDNSNCPINLFRRDFNGMADIIDNLMHGAVWDYQGCVSCSQATCPDGQDPMFHGFHWLINEIRSLVANERSYNLLCKRYGPFAHRHVITMPQAARTRMRDMIVGAAQPRSEAMHAKIEELLTAEDRDDAQNASA